MSLPLESRPAAHSLLSLYNIPSSSHIYSAFLLEKGYPWINIQFIVVYILSMFIIFFSFVFKTVSSAGRRTGNDFNCAARHFIVCCRWSCCCCANRQFTLWILQSRRGLILLLYSHRVLFLPLVRHEPLLRTTRYPPFKNSMAIGISV